MAAVTDVVRKETVWGNKRVLLITCVASDTETYDTGYHNVESMIANDADGGAVGGTWSAGVVTFQTDGSDQAIRAIIVCSN